MAVNFHKLDHQPLPCLQQHPPKQTRKRRKGVPQRQRQQRKEPKKQTRIKLHPGATNCCHSITGMLLPCRFRLRCRTTADIRWLLLCHSALAAALPGLRHPDLHPAAAAAFATSTSVPISCCCSSSPPACPATVHSWQRMISRLSWYAFTTNSRGLNTCSYFTSSVSTSPTLRLQRSSRHSSTPWSASALEDTIS